MTGSTHDAYGVRKTADPAIQGKLTARLYNKIMNRKEEIIEYEGYYLEDADIAVVCYGFTARSALFAVGRLREEGIRVGMLRLNTLWPFADAIVRDVGSEVKKILVPEMNMGQIVGEVMKYAAGEVIPYNQMNGQVIYPNTIIEQVRRLL